MHQRSGLISAPDSLSSTVMVSGIGPRTTLQKYGIQVISKLPGVCANWQDQLFVFAAFHTNQQTDSATVVDPLRLENAQEQYIKYRTGPLTSPGLDLVGWEKFTKEYRVGLSSQAKAVIESYPADWPDIEFIGASLGAANPEDPTNNHLFAIVVALSIHNLVGSINITSGSILAPILNANILTTTEDRELMLAAPEECWSCLKQWVL